uniref:LURP-one-related family protein n=1 Tax=Panagrolaimus sp. PS1159 TaxID=55785 RepID=A0AC35G038_9BILA
MTYYPPPSEKSQQKYPPPSRRYQIREKIFSIGDNFKIKDEAGEPVFAVRSKIFSIGDKLVLEDMAGNALIKIRQELFHLMSRFTILSAQDNQELATVTKKLTLLRPKFTIDSIYGNYKLDGLDILAHSFLILKDGQVVATVGKKFFSWTDSYGVEIVGSEDHAFIMSLVMVLDQVIYDNN